MADDEGRVPEHLREVLRGLRATGDNDVARGLLEDDHPLRHAGRVLDEGEVTGDHSADHGNVAGR